MFQRLMSRRALLSPALLLLVLAVSCEEKGYRTEVYPGEEGRTVVKHIPVETPPARTVVQAPAPSPAAETADADLSTLQSLWPKLSPEDRKRVADMARRLATSQP